jgi:hypothetical protein
MNTHLHPKVCFTLLCAALLVSLPVQSSVHAADLSGNYTWKPVRLGAGGFVTGLVIHPANPDVRYCRTDVGNAYRWDTTVNEWVPMVVRNGTTGIPASVAVAPARIGVESIAVDPQNTNIVLISFPARYSSGNGLTSLAGSVFRSTDGGRNFTQSDLNVTMAPNDGWRNKGECMGIDPNDGQIAYYGSRAAGLWKSVNGGLNWTQLTAGGAPAATATVIGIRFDRVSPTATTVYAVVGGGSVLKSTDAGATWADVGAGSTLANAPANSTVDLAGNLYVAKNGTTKICKMTRAGVWSELTATFGSSGNTINNVAVDPANPSRLFAIGNGGCVSRSLNGGAIWTSLGNFLQFGNTFGWLPQLVNGSPSGWRSNGGIQFDSNGRLWISQGNEGVLNVTPSATNTETAASPLLWKINSKGIEEFVGRDVTIPPGSGDQPVVTMEDGTGFLIENPDTFVSVQSSLATTQLISNGTAVSVCPNDPDFIVIATADIHGTSTGQDFSGYSTDGGLSWTKFLTRPGTPSVKAGIIAVGRRNGWSTGSDHLVWYPVGNRAPFWSHDGGQTWTLGAGLNANATSGAFTDGTSAFWDASLKQHTLVADQLVPDKFYFYTPWGGQSRLFSSVDGGVNWTPVTGHGLPSAGHNATILSNPYQLDDYWFVDGQEGSATHGVWRSTNGGTVYGRLTTVDRANNIAIGKGAGTPGAAAFSLYIYGRLTSTTEWGVFRSIDAGVTWDRLSYFPAGQIDMPTSLAASQDTFGLVYISYLGNSYVYGRPGAAITVPNAGFEAATNWSVWYDSSKSANPYSRVQDDTAPGGLWRGTLGGYTTYNTTVYQTVSGLANGTYTLRGLFKSGGGHTSIRFMATNYDSSGTYMWTAIPVSNSTYVQVTLPNIPVSNGKVVINVYAVSNTGGWVHFDQIELSKD